MLVPPDAAFRVLAAVHRRLFDGTGGRIGGRLMGMSVVKLTTIGRRSGRPRETMLTAPIADDDQVVLVASKGGAPAHPAWYLNLAERPRVTVTYGGRDRRMVARTLDAEEKAVYWPRVVQAYRGYGSYQRRTDRDIPVVVLTPDPEG